MRIKLLAIVIGLIHISGESFSQDTLSLPHNRPQYFISLMAGGSFGEKGNGSTLSSSIIQGIRLNRFSFGAGVGFDAYENWRTVPLFASVSFDFIRKGQSAIYLQANGGYAITHYINSPDWTSTFEEIGGVMLNPMVGYRVNADKFSVYFAAGYKFQRLGFDYSTQCVWCSSFPSPHNNFEVQQDIERLVLMIGIGLR